MGLLRSLAERLGRAPPQPPSVDAPRPGLAAPRNSPWVGLRDRRLSGWFDPDGNELVTGFAITAADTVLDVGCGAGGYAQYCAKHAARVILVDVDPQKLEEASRAMVGPAEITAVASDARPLPLPDHVATKIICTEVLEHVDDPGPFMAELVRVGAPGAVYLFTVPDPVSEGFQKRLAPAFYFEKPNHVRVFERETFAKTVEDAGLVIAQQTHDGFYSAMRLNLLWAADAPDHPLLEHWSNTWNALMDTQGGANVKAVLDDCMPRTQRIIAAKPIAD
jgi:SAM-dependent methyltransferase